MIITDVYGTRRVGFHPFCLSVLFSARCHKKNDAARIKSDIEMFHDESWKPTYFGLKRSDVMGHKNSAGVGHYTLVSAGFC